MNRKCFCCVSDGDDEFGGWCAKALAAHNDVIDGEFGFFFTTFFCPFPEESQQYV